MPLLRLIGLALFITAIFLALAAAITKTTHIRVQFPGSSNSNQPLGQNENVVLPPPLDPRFASEIPQAETNEIQFTPVPIVWPLVIAAGTGLLMWFMHPSEPIRPTSSNKKRQRR